jgi:hypothetical protein
MWNQRTRFDTTPEPDPSDPQDPDLIFGWDFKGMNWQLTAQSQENQTTFSNMRNHGVNLIRRHFSTSPLMEEGSGNRTTYLNRMKTNLTWAAARGMWVMFDFYERPIKSGSGGLAAMYWQWEMPESQFLAMWDLLATELGSYGNAILELGNEPNDRQNTEPEHRDIWMQRCIKAIPRMRNLGYTGYIVIPFPEVATHGHTGVKYRDQVRSADPLNKYMWDFHYYWYWQESQAGSPNDYSISAIRSWLSRNGISNLRQAGDRVLCGEFGTKGQNPDTRDRQWFENMMTVMKADGYDMCGQSFQPGGDFPMLTGNWGTTNWNTLNSTGNYFKNNRPSVLEYYSA